MAALLALFQACSSAPKPSPPPPLTHLQARIEASKQLNPSVSGRASPLVLRIYELKAATGFNDADFVSLFEHDATQLGSDLVSKDEMILEPGQSRIYPRALASETRFIGVFGAYRDLEHASWRSVVAIEPGKSQVMLISAGGRDLDAHLVR